MRKIKSTEIKQKKDALPYQLIPAKTFQLTDGTVVKGRSVLEHCLIVGHVAQEIIERCFPDDMKDLFPRGAELLAALHDVGKVSPTFVEKILRATSGYTPNSHPFLSAAEPQFESQWGGHAGVSQAELRKILPFGHTPYVAGQHHGFLPDLKGKTEQAESFGAEPWQKERDLLIRELCKVFKSEIPDIRDVHTARLVSGLTTVSDWIGSAGHFNDPGFKWEGEIGNALDAAGFTTLDILKNQSFTDIFDFAPNQMQTSFVEQIKGPGVYVLEAQMGLGKTEAALHAAYMLLEQGKARGIYFALPTKLTSEKIYDRLASFASKVLDPQSQAAKPMLLHGSAWFMQELDLGEDGAPGGSWFNQGKRGVLAPLAVGTVDQALMAVMNVKHGFIRTFGLAGKVVIIDEVHSYDTYTGTILNSLIQTLMKLKCTVIILSATLNLAQKKELIGSGCTDNRYPLITTKAENQPLVEVAPPADESRQTKVAIRRVSDIASTAQEAIERARSGQQILWIENTVAEAQARFQSLRHLTEDTNIECGLIHSRFIPSHRQINEDRWVGIYGKNGGEQRGHMGRILVGTQVLEQSIDIDADFLIARFCPTDMLFQRLGRLWRHAATKRPAGARCEAALIVPTPLELEKDIKKAFGNSAFVYDPYVLYRSLKVWSDRNEISLPADIRPLIDQTYQDTPHVSGDIAKLFHELENGIQYGRNRKPGRNQLKQIARNTLTLIGAQASDERPPTRYSEQETVEVLILRDMKIKSETQSSTLISIDGKTIEVPLTKAKLTRRQSRTLAMFIAQNTVSVNPWLAPKALTIGHLKSFGLHNIVFLGSPEKGDHEDALIRVALVDRAGRISNNNQSDDKFFYRQDMGYWKEGV